MDIDTSKYYIENEQIPEDDNASSIVSVRIEDLPHSSKDDGLDPLILRVKETITDSEAKDKCNELSPNVNTQFSPPSVDQFLRNYLQENGFTETLNIYQAEWFKFLHKGLLNEEAAPVSDIYIENNELRNIIKDIRSENLTLKTSISKLDDELKKVKNERDYHMIKHRQTLQDKEKLHCDIKRVKEHYAEYEPILRLLRQKYETAMKEKTLHRIERDRAMNQVEGLRHALNSLQKLGITSNDTNDIENIDLDQNITEKKLEHTINRLNKIELDQKSKKNFLKSEKSDIHAKFGNNLKKGLCEHTFLGHTHSINHAIFNQQGTNVISCDSGGVIRLWDLRKMDNFALETNLPNTIKAKLPNNNNNMPTKSLPSCFDLNKTRQIDRPTHHHHHHQQQHQQQPTHRQNPTSTQHPHHQQHDIQLGGINQLAIDLNSEYIVAACDDAKLYCVEISTGQISTLQGHDSSIQSIVLDYESGYLYSASNDQKICSWI
ncbi:unnamed protein product [Schistosoma turkestanicum]|nr:unnamed protein product [Schistosoma turkestanicum]